MDNAHINWGLEHIVNTKKVMSKSHVLEPEALYHVIIYKNYTPEWVKVFRIIPKFSNFSYQKMSEYDQEMPHSHTVDQPMAP